MKEPETTPHELSTLVLGKRALMQAICGGHIGVAMRLLDHGISVNSPLPWKLFDLDQEQPAASISAIPRIIEVGCFPLQIAVAREDTPMVELLLETGADPDLCINDYKQDRHSRHKWRSPLVHAAELDNIKIAELLIDHGAEIESQVLPCPIDPGGTEVRYPAPLIQAALSGSVSMVDFLLEAGANSDFFDFRGFTPLVAAATGSQLECAKILIRNGAGFFNRPGVSLISPTMAAIQIGSKEILQLLLDSVLIGRDLSPKLPIVESTNQESHMILSDYYSESPPLLMETHSAGLRRRR
jgi:ankyrin repeat protein